MQGALSGLKVLDLSRLLPGPFCTMLMADLGADVIKVEEPGKGDYLRWWPPLIGGQSGFHLALNRNKRSVTLNLKDPGGRAVFQKLVSKADVVLESFRPGVMSKLGLGFAELEKINPRLVYCAISGYGADGPLAARAGHDVNYLSMSGVLSYSGRNSPTLSGVQIADIGGGGLLAAFSIMAALFAREKIGKGQFIDISMTDGSFAWNCLRLGKFAADGLVPAAGDDMLNHGLACYNVYETKDGRHMGLGALEPQFWKSFCRAAGRPDWDVPEYFESGAHQEKLTAQLTDFFRRKTMAEWVDHFRDVDCCCEPVLNFSEVMSGSLMKERKMVVELVHESWGAYRQLGIAPKFSLTPGSLRSHAPSLGEHTRQVLEKAGYTPEEIDGFHENGVV